VALLDHRGDACRGPGLRVLTAYASDEPGAAVTRLALHYCWWSRQLRVQKYFVRVVVMGGLVAGGIMLSRGVAGWGWPWAGAVIVKLWSAWMTPRWGWPMWVHEMLGGSGAPRPPFCPSCGYALAGLAPAGDGRVGCPECGTGWKLRCGE
jgi:hypothetical protein